MSVNGVEQLQNLLFEDGRELANIKFLPGVNRGLTADDMSDEAARVLNAALQKGPVNNPPMSGLDKVQI